MTTSQASDTSSASPSTTGQASSARPPVVPTSGLLLLAALTLIWGCNWPFMKIALSEISVLWFRTTCVVFGGILLLLMSKLTGGRLTLPLRQVPALLLCALFGIVGWHLFTGYSLSQMPAGRAAIIAYLMPVFASILSVYILGERLYASKVLGLIVGMTGLGALIGPDLWVIQTAPVGALLMVGAATSWAAGTVLYKKFKWGAPTATVIGWQLLAAAIPIATCAISFEPFPDIKSISAHVWAALAYVVFVPMVFGQWAYYRIVNMMPASVAAISTLAIPAVGVYSSSLLLGEPIGWREISALALISIALSVVLFVPAILARRT
ncbi:MAG: DMT family transporter [Pseudomonadota bacterium]